MSAWDFLPPEAIKEFTAAEPPSDLVAVETVTTTPTTAEPAFEIVPLLDYALALPDADDVSPGHLGQLIAAVAYAYAGKPIRPGQKTLEERIAALEAACAAGKM